MSTCILQVYEPAERSAVQMNPVTDFAQAFQWWGSEDSELGPGIYTSRLEWMIKSHYDISINNMGLFNIAVLAIISSKLARITLQLEIVL